MWCSVANILHLPFVIMLTPPLQDVIVQWSRHRICCFLISVALLLGTSSAPSWFLLFARDHLFLSRLLGALRLFRRRLRWSRRRQSQLDLRGEWWFRDLFSWSFISMSAPMVSAPSWSGDDQARWRKSNRQPASTAILLPESGPQMRLFRCGLLSDYLIRKIDSVSWSRLFPYSNWLSAKPGSRQ